ncbi:MAG: LUD domain-containing protein [Thermoplasmata archaeon]
MSFDRQRLKRLIDEQDSLEGMRNAFRTTRKRQQENAHLMPDLEARKERLRKVKAESVGNDSLLATAVERLRSNGFRIEFAKNDAQAIEILTREIGSEKTIVKSKSNISKEIDLAHRLSERGIEVIETDLGDRIIQISGLTPVHPTGPAAHLTRYQIAEILSKHFGRELPPDPDVLSEAVREELDGYLLRSRIGITGANAIAANEGAVVILHNEGNVTRCAQSRMKHIILTTRDKIVPSLDDAINLAKIQAYFATGKIVSAHIDIISGPSYTADIEKKIFKGMHGPKEIVIVFVDSGRTELGNCELLYCINCGNCLLTCPVYDIIGPSFGSKGHLGGIGAGMVGRMRSPEEADSAGIFLCSSCGICKEACPVEIDVRPEIYSSRAKAADKGLLSNEHKSVLSSIRNYDNPWMQPRKSKTRWANAMNLPSKGDTLYFPGCSLSLLRPELAKATVGLLRECGLDPAYLHDDDICCGSIARKLGDEELFREQISRLMRSIQRAQAKTVITSCPGCMISLIMGRDSLGIRNLEICHVSQVLSGLPVTDAGKERGVMKVAYHDPCELGRGLGIFDPPRSIIDSIDGVERIELERSRKDSACCGAGAGLRTGFPELATAIAKKRLLMARDAGAKILITSCPWCLENLQSACQGMDIEVADLVGFLMRYRSSK